MSGSADTIFDTERLLVRMWRDADAAALFELYGTPDVARHSGQPEPGTPGAALRRARSSHPWAVAERASGDVVGEVGAIFRIWVAAFEISVAILPRSRRRGYATEALVGAIRYVRAPVLIAVRLDNHPSRRLVERLGLPHVRVESRPSGKHRVWRASAAEARAALDARTP